MDNCVEQNSGETERKEVEFRKIENMIVENSELRMKFYVGQVVFGVFGLLFFALSIFAAQIVPLRSLDAFYYGMLSAAIIADTGSRAMNMLTELYPSFRLANWIQREKISYGEYMKQYVSNNVADKKNKRKFKQRILGIFYYEKPNEKIVAFVFSILRSIIWVVLMGVLSWFAFSSGYIAALFSNSVSVHIDNAALYIVFCCIAMIVFMTNMIFYKKSNNNYEEWLNNFSEKKTSVN